MVKKHAHFIGYKDDQQKVYFMEYEMMWRWGGPATTFPRVGVRIPGDYPAINRTAGKTARPGHAHFIGYKDDQQKAAIEDMLLIALIFALMSIIKVSYYYSTFWCSLATVLCVRASSSSSPLSQRCPQGSPAGILEVYHMDGSGCNNTGSPPVKNTSTCSSFFTSGIPLG